MNANGIFFTEAEQAQMYPLTYTKPYAELRMGILTFKERWEKLLRLSFSYLTEDYLSIKYPLQQEDVNLYLNPSYFPTKELIAKLRKLKEGQAIVQDNELIACMATPQAFEEQSFSSKEKLKKEAKHISHPYHLFSYNKEALAYDFDLVTKRRKSQKMPEGNRFLNEERIFISKKAEVHFSILDPGDSFIYIGEGAKISAGSIVQGGLALCDHAQLNIGAKIYGATTIGPWSKVGGEVNNSILTAYSNKGHEGFLGNSVIGEWCNLGADTNNSNLKNNYGEVKLWSYVTDSFEPTGLQFCGLIMGDHSKSAINSQFNTGTVAGVFANVFCAGFPPKKIDSFTWGGQQGAMKFQLEAAFQVAERMMSRRKVPFTKEDREIVEYLYHLEP